MKKNLSLLLACVFAIASYTSVKAQSAITTTQHIGPGDYYITIDLAIIMNGPYIIAEVIADGTVYSVAPLTGANAVNVYFDKSTTSFPQIRVVGYDSMDFNTQLFYVNIYRIPGNGGGGDDPEEAF